MPENAQAVHKQKIALAKRSLEENDGHRIKEDKIQEWALLEIVDLLGGINYQLIHILAELPKLRK